MVRLLSCGQVRLARRVHKPWACVLCPILARAYDVRSVVPLWSSWLCLRRARETLALPPGKLRLDLGVCGTQTLHVRSRARQTNCFPVRVHELPQRILGERGYVPIRLGSNLAQLACQTGSEAYGSIHGRNSIISAFFRPPEYAPGRTDSSGVCSGKRSARAGKPRAARGWTSETPMG